MTYLDKTIKDGYVRIAETEIKQQIVYRIAEERTEYFGNPEEKIRAEVLAELIYKYEYPAHRIKIELYTLISVTDILKYLTKSCIIHSFNWSY